MALPKTFLPVISVEEYLAIERMSEIRHEFLDGLVYAIAGESPDHSRICFNLASNIGVQIKNQPCEGFSPNMKVKAGESGLYAYPDLMIVYGKAVFHDQHGDVLLNPTVIFEVLSPSTEAYDRGEKFLRYRSHIGSLQDYVMVLQDRPQIEHYSRQADGAWLLSEVSGLSSELFICSIDCHIPLGEVYSHTRVAETST
jgi:Uma2 family endonuclease